MQPTRLLLWGGVGLWVATSVVCFMLAGPRVALRSRSVGAGSVAALLGYVALLLLHHRAFHGAELLLFVALLLLSLLMLVGWELWLVRAGITAVEEQIATGCSGLFIASQRLPRHGVLLTVRNVEWRIRLQPLGPRLTWVVLPRPKGRGKVSLLVNWLAKQYPGPFPRPRIRLK